MFATSGDSRLRRSGRSGNWCATGGLEGLKFRRQFRSLGYTILRFPNSEVFSAPATILDRIAAEARRLQSESGKA